MVVLGLLAQFFSHLLFFLDLGREEWEKGGVRGRERGGKEKKRVVKGRPTSHL